METPKLFQWTFVLNLTLAKSYLTTEDIIAVRCKKVVSLSQSWIQVKLCQPSRIIKAIIQVVEHMEILLSSIIKQYKLYVAFQNYVFSNIGYTTVLKLWVNGGIYYPEQVGLKTILHSEIKRMQPVHALRKKT